MSLLQRAMGSISRDSDSSTPTGPANRRQSGGSGGARGSPYARPSGDSWKHDKFDEAASQSATTTSTSPQGGSLAGRLSGSVTPLGPGKGARSSRLIIKDLHYEVSERELELLFVQIGPIASGPKIKFDKSGRSTGLAWIGFTSEEHAQQAKEAFDGALAKGQNIRVEYDFRPERVQPAPGSLLSRLDSTPTAGRGGRGGPASSVRGGRPHVGPQRGVGSDSRPPRSGAPGGPRSARGGESGGGRGGKARREPTTNADLDKELEAFMKSPDSTDKPAAATTQASAPTPATAEASGDVEMS
ncbi:uncharacterized protein JCM6883_005445 [Sporobolomyces salmoneus]|uniref:uncharacterized protein n=1 Tax=Sporobolomyces salmoneus TaxID=183962 RepID=UPI00316ECE6A